MKKNAASDNIPLLWSQPQSAARGRLRDRTERAADVDVMKRVGRAGIVLTSQEKRKENVSLVNNTHCVRRQHTWVYFDVITIKQIQLVFFSDVWKMIFDP